jgi:hypothetical protein
MPLKLSFEKTQTIWNGIQIGAANFCHKICARLLLQTTNGVFATKLYLS